MHGATAGGATRPRGRPQRPPDKPPAVERPGEPPEGAGRGGPGASFLRAWSFATRAQPYTATHPRSRGKGGRSRRVSGRAPCHGKAGVLFEPGGWPEAYGRGRPAQAKTRRQRRGWGPAVCQGRRRDAWAAHREKPARPPQSCCGGTRAGGTGVRARMTHTKRQKAQRKGSPNGTHKCNKEIITASYPNKEQGRKLAHQALLWYHVIADNRIPQH